MLVSALIRRVAVEGGHAAVLTRGDPESGGILLACADRGRVSHLIERVLDLDGRYRWARCGPQESADPEAVSQYLERRRTRDPDIWIVELDIADAERFAAETIASN